MTLGSIIGWIFAGLIVGAIARLLVPGRQGMGIMLTIVLGIVGAIVGGLISTALFGPRFVAVTDGTMVDYVQTAWPGWIMAVIGGILVLVAALSVFGPRRPV